MKIILFVLLSFGLAGEMEVDGNLKVTGTIQNDSLAQVIAQLEARIAQLECTNSGNIPTGYCDCFGNVLDACGVCGGETQNADNCPPNYALSFDGNDDYVSIDGDVLPSNSDFTIETWIKLESTGNTMQLVDKMANGGYRLEINSHGDVILQYKDSNSNKTEMRAEAIIDGNDVGNWIHIAATADISIPDIKIYKNGNPQTIYVNDTDATSIGLVSDSLYIGRRIDGYEHFDGFIDEIRVSNIVRYTTDYTPEIYFINDEDTQSLWKFNAGEGDILYDHSGNGNNGSIHGATWVERE